MPPGIDRFLKQSCEKVVAHYLMVLRDRSIPELEREAIERRLMRAKADVDLFDHGRSWSQIHLTEAA